MVNGIPKEAVSEYTIHPDKFLTRYNFVLSQSQKVRLASAKAAHKNIKIAVAYMPFGKYLLELEVANG